MRAKFRLIWMRFLTLVKAIKDAILMDQPKSRDLERLDTGRPRVTFAKCGTQESWERYQSSYPDAAQVIPATIYINKCGIFLITSKEWVDWLLGNRENRPDEDAGYDEG